MDKLNIFCPHFFECSGCLFDTDVVNTPVFQEAKEFFINLGISDFKLNSGVACGWRCRAKLAVRGNWKEPLIGLFKKGSHEVVNIPDCQVHHPLINRALELLRQWIQDYQIAPYQEKTGQGVLRYVELSVDRERQRVQLVLVVNQNQEEAFLLENQKKAIENLWQAHPKFWHSFWLNFNKRRDNIILGDVWQHLYGEEWLWDKFSGRDVCFHPASFAQANPEMFEKLLVKLGQNVPRGTRAVEFYAGGGVIGLTLAEKCERISFNEIVPLAERCFNESCKRLGKELKHKLSFFSGSAEKQIDLIRSDVDLVIVDPPRKGIDEALLNFLCGPTFLKQLIYVSCGWKSFKKDCKKLLEHHWKLSVVEGFLFFPGSDHLEILAVFHKES